MAAAGLPSIKKLKEKLSSIVTKIKNLVKIEDDTGVKKLEKEMESIQEDILREIDNTDSSSFVGKATYTPELSTVEFLLNGNLYNYCNVPFRKWDSYVGSPSKGASYNRLFKGQNLC